MDLTLLIAYYSGNFIYSLNTYYLELALIGFYLLFPALVIYLCYRFPLINKIGAVIICYLVGMLVGNYFTFSPAMGEVQNTLTSAAVALALPLLLFSMDVGVLGGPKVL